MTTSSLVFRPEQPCGQGSQLFGVAAKHSPLGLALNFHFQCRDSNYCHKLLFVDIDLPLSGRTKSSWTGAESVLRLL